MDEGGNAVVRHLPLWLTALLFALIAVPAGAQTSIGAVRPVTATASLTTSTCSGSTTPQTGCVAVNMGGYKSAAIQLTGTWSGTVTFESTVDGTTWVTQNMLPSTGAQTAVTTATANGVWYTQQTNMVVSAVRARFSTATSGTVVVTIRGSL